MDLLGKMLGNYRIDRLLGEGSMGAVYQAHDVSLQRDVAIKAIREDIARRPNVRQRFVQEARVMAHLDHPGIVKVFTVSTSGDVLFIVMEYLPGGNLLQLLEELKQKNKWLPLHESIHIVEQLCGTLEYAHKNKVLHRDIKPSNLMFKREPANGLPFRVILTDLGLAKLLEGQGITQEKTSLGTPAYMSPEQASGRATDARSDIYSLGVLLYELAVGRLPFPIRTIAEAARYHPREAPPPPRSIRPDLPEDLERVILKAMEKDPAKRYASAAEFGKVLAEISSGSTEKVEPAGAQGNGLITVYEHSIIAPPAPAKPKAGGPQTIFDAGSATSRGPSVFGNVSVPPSPQTRIQVVQKGKRPELFPMSSGTVTIGRGPQNDITLADPKASQRHLQVTWDGMEYHVMDLNSKNGTYLGRTKLLPGIPDVWAPNQNLRVGDTWLRLIRASMNSQEGSVISRSRLGASALFKSPGAGQVGVRITPEQLSVEAGGSVSGTLSLINESPNVDHFSLSLAGIPSGWIVTLPSSMQLMPGNQMEVPFSLQVPRASQSRAGKHNLTLKVTSQSDPSQYVEAKLVLTVAPYTQFKTELQPQRIRIGQTGRLTIFNQGNFPATFIIQIQEDAEALDFRLTPKEPTIPEGQSGVVEIEATPRKQILIGNDKVYPITAAVTTANAEPQIQAAQVITRALLPRWVVPVAFVLCMLLGLLASRVYGNVVKAQQTRTATAMTATNVSLGLTATATWLPGDDDRDGLTNQQEINEFKTLPGDRDTDKDGLDDGPEVNDFHTNPLSADTDSDGRKDGEEVSSGLDPTKRDTDGDGIPDNVDTAPNATPTLQPSPTNPPSATTAPTTPAPPPPASTTQPPTTQAPPPPPYTNNFEGRVGLEWSNGKSTQAPNGQNFLGDFGNVPVILSLENLSGHSSVTLNFDLYVINTWDGNGPPKNTNGPDIWMLEAVGETKTLLMMTTFCNDNRKSNPPPTPADSCQQAYPGPKGGPTNYPARQDAIKNDSLGYDADSIYHLNFTFSHSGPSLVLIFSASGLEDLSNESWGLDNIEVVFK